MWLAQRGNVWLRTVRHVGEEGLHVEGCVLDVMLESFAALAHILGFNWWNLVGSHSSVSLLSPHADSALRVVFYPCDFNTLTGNISTLTYIRFMSTSFCCTGFHSFYWRLGWSLYHVRILLSGSNKQGWSNFFSPPSHIWGLFDSVTIGKTYAFW